MHRRRLGAGHAVRLPAVWHPPGRRDDRLLFGPHKMDLLLPHKGFFHVQVSIFFGWLIPPFRRRSYEALALAALGPTGRRFIEMCLLFFLVSSIIAFMVVIGDIGPHVVADYLDLEAPTAKLRTLVMVSPSSSSFSNPQVLVTLFIIFPLSLINDLEKFSIVSSLAIFFYAVFVVRMVSPPSCLSILSQIAEAVPVIWDGKWSVNVIWWRSSGFLTWCLLPSSPIFRIQSAHRLHGHVLSNPALLRD